MVHPPHRGFIRGLNADANLPLAEAGFPDPQNPMGNTPFIFNLCEILAHQGLTQSLKAILAQKVFHYSVILNLFVGSLLHSRDICIGRRLTLMRFFHVRGASPE